MNTYGLTKEEYINLLKSCGMTTKKWTLSKWKDFDKKRKEIIYLKQNKKNIFDKFFKKKIR